MVGGRDTPGRGRVCICLGGSGQAMMPPPSTLQRGPLAPACLQGRSHQPARRELGREVGEFLRDTENRRTLPPFSSFVPYPGSSSEYWAWRERERQPWNVNLGPFVGRFHLLSSKIEGWKRQRSC